MFPYIDHFIIGIPDKSPLLHHIVTCQSNLKHGKTIYQISRYVEKITTLIIYCIIMPY